MNDKDNSDNVLGKFFIKNFPKNRQILSDIYDEFLKKHYMHGYIEINITKGKELIKQYHAKTKEKISFTSWIVKCIADSVQQYPEFNSYRKGRTKIIEFQDIDIIVMVERKLSDKVIPVPYSIRKCNTKDLLSISQEIREAQNNPVSESNQLLEEGKILKFYNFLPKFLRQRIIRRMVRNPFYVKKQGGLIVLTSVGMFVKTSGWIGGSGGITTLNIALGGINKKLMKSGDTVNQEEFLQMTISLDHDIIDGAPAARFTAYLTDLIQKGHHLTELN
jgi:pyruvate/2-oxoglutarate dehydrogenase complex dihydrolipoamide acyltransferase (E2) component